MTTLVGSMPSFTYTSGPTMPFGQDLESLANNTLGAISGVIAHAGGTQASGLVLPAQVAFVQVDTVASGSDSVVLPPASLPGDFYWITNNAATNTLDIYAATANPANGTTLDKITPSGTVTANSNTTALTLATGVSTLLVCTKLGMWKQMV